MIRSEMRARVAANEPASAKNAAALPPLVDRPPALPARPRPPWVVRHSRKATIALVLATIAALPFAYWYLHHNFGPDPLVGIQHDIVKFDAGSGMMEVVKSAEVKPVEAKPAGAKP